MDPLSVRLIPDGVVYPTIRVASRPGQLLMGVFDGDGRYVDDTALNRRAGEQGAPVPRDLYGPVADADTPEAVYAGPLYFHFGHFLLESLARAWYAHRHPELPFVWAGQHDWQDIELMPWQSEILDLLGITSTRVIADPTRFGVLHVPDLGYRYDDRFHPEHAEFLARYSGPAQVAGERLWLSRSKISTDARDLNSEPTERRLAAAGWTIAYPELLTIGEQLDHLSRAETVAGEEGSAFHTLVLLKELAGKQFHILRRHGREHPNMHTVGDARSVQQSFHTVQRQRVLRAEGRVVSKVTPNSSEILDLLGVPVPDLTVVPATAALTALHRTLAHLDPPSFLEVGAGGAELSVRSTAPVRVAVNPRFDVDPRSHAGSTIDFYELSLVDYAKLFHAGRGRFDVIRVTGPDFGQVMESFRISKRLSHSGTTWILGSGPVAARVALAIRLTHSSFAVRRLLVHGRLVYVARQVPGAPKNEAAVAELSEPEVRGRVRWMRVTSLRRIRGR